MGFGDPRHQQFQESLETENLEQHYQVLNHEFLTAMRDQQRLSCLSCRRNPIKATYDFDCEFNTWTNQVLPMTVECKTDNSNYHNILIEALGQVPLENLPSSLREKKAFLKAGTEDWDIVQAFIADRQKGLGQNEKAGLLLQSLPQRIMLSYWFSEVMNKPHYLLNANNLQGLVLNNMKTLNVVLGPIQRSYIDYRSICVQVPVSWLNTIDPSCIVFSCFAKVNNPTLSN